MKLIARCILIIFMLGLFLAQTALASGLGDQLVTAVVMDDESGAQAAIGEGANVNGKDREGVTALMEAASYGRPEIAKLLIEKGADINAKDKHGCTALMRAAMADRTEVAKILTEKGADINAKDKLGDTALSLASQWGSGDIAAMLKKAGAK